MKVIINTSILQKPLAGLGNYVYNIARYLKELDNTIEYVYYYDGYLSQKLLSSCVQKHSKNKWLI